MLVLSKKRFLLRIGPTILEIKFWLYSICIHLNNTSIWRLASKTFKIKFDILKNVHSFLGLRRKRCFVEKVVDVNNNIDFIDFLPLILVTTAEAFSVIGSDSLHIASVSTR
jgi:hypothetical protein